jgi:hypothetical protein
LARIAGVFATRGLIPSELIARRSCAGLWIGLHLDIERDAAERLAEKLRAIVPIDAVILVHAPEKPLQAMSFEVGPRKNGRSSHSLQGIKGVTLEATRSGIV